MHKKIAQDLIKQGELDKVIYVPTGDCYHKKDLVAAKHRYQMLQLMIQKNSKLEVSDYELKGTLTYTYQTLDYFQQQYPEDEIYFICGADNLKEIKTWKNYEFILKNFKVIVVKRDLEDLDAIVNFIGSENIRIANIEFVPISSTEIRKNIQRKQNDYLVEMIDSSVLDYIKKEKLYGRKG